MGYGGEQEDNKESQFSNAKIIVGEKTKSYAEALKNIQEPRQQNHGSMIVKRTKTIISRINFKGIEPSRRFTSKYQSLLLGNCGSCGNFGHKAIKCRVGIIKTYRNDENTNNNDSIHFYRPNDSKHDNFGALDYDVGCYIYHNFVHKSRNYKSKEFIPQRGEEDWISTNQ